MPASESTAFVIGMYQTVLPFRSAMCFTGETVGSATLPEYFATCACAYAKPAFSVMAEAPDAETPTIEPPKVTSASVADATASPPFFNRNVDSIN